MGIEKSFRNSEEILKVSDLVSKCHRKFKTVIVTFQSKVLPGLLEQNLIKPVEGMELGTAHGKYPIYQLVANDDILFYLCPIGAPTVVGFLEEVVYSMEIENIVLYGTCGILDKEIATGKIIVPTKAYRDEGTSYHYQEASDFIDIDKYYVVSKILSEFNIDYVEGYTWTTDAFYRETKEIYEERKKQGCIAVEMEISAVQAFSNLRGVNFYPFIYGADSLDSSSWKKGILGNLEINERIKYFIVASEIAKRVSVEEK